jgi:hypothetical protein
VNDFSLSMFETDRERHENASAKFFQTEDFKPLHIDVEHLAVRPEHWLGSLNKNVNC